MGVLKSLTDEYFGKNIRKEDEINVDVYGVGRKDFTDTSGKIHKNGYYVLRGHKSTLRLLIETIIKNYGNNCDLNCIDVSNIKDMSGLFQGLSKFNGNISHWNVSGVENMYSMFNCAESFNKPLNDWDVSNVENMGQMFRNAEKFNQPLDGWSKNLGKVENMDSMFAFATNFNQDIETWDVSNVRKMWGMFQNAKTFNKPLNGWGDKLGNIKDMTFMFGGASSFNQPLNDWKVDDVKKMSGMFVGTPLEKNPPKWYKEEDEIPF